MLCVLVPEVEGAIAAGGAEGAMLRVEGNGVDGIDVGDVALVGCVLSVALETEVGAAVKCQFSILCQREGELEVRTLRPCPRRIG